MRISSFACLTALLFAIGLRPNLARADLAGDLCRYSAIQGIKVVGTDGFNQRDLCGNSKPLNPVTKNLIQQIGKLNGKVAGAFGVHARNLLGAGPVIKFSGFGWGALRGFGGIDDEITNEVFPEWDGKWFDPATYVHELTHFILRKPNAYLPKGLFELAEKELLKEGLADLTAFQIEGKIFSESPYLPLCFTQVRILEGRESFDLPGGFFEQSFSTRKLIACCEDQVPFDQKNYVNRLCAWAIKPADRELTRFDEAKFNSTKYAVGKFMGVTRHESLDVHQLGLVMNAFFIASANRQNKTPWKMIQDASRELGRELYKRYECLNGGNKRMPSSVLVPAIDALIKHISSNNSDEGRIFSNHRMKVAIQMDRARAAIEAKEACSKLSGKFINKIMFFVPSNRV